MKNSGLFNFINMSPKKSISPVKLKAQLDKRKNEILEKI